MISSEKSSKLNTSAIGVDIFNCLEGKKPANLSSTNKHPVTMFSMRYRKKNNCKVYNCPTIKITTNICAALFYILTKISEFMGKTFQAAQLTHERFLTIDHSCKIFF